MLDRTDSSSAVARPHRPAFLSRRESQIRAAFIVGAVTFFGFYLFAARQMLGDPDTLWHVFFGRWIAATRSFPHVDQWSYTAAGEPWIAKEWLSQLLYAGADWVAGNNGVVGLAAASVATSFALLTWFSLRRLPPLLACFCVASAIILCLQHLVARPHVLAFPFIVLWFAGLARACDRREPPSLLLLPVMLAWANLHAGFTLGLLVACGFAACALVEAGPRARLLVRPWLLFLILALAVGCLTPYGAQPIAVTWTLMTFGQSLSQIAEWAPPNFQQGKVELAVFLAWCALALLNRRPYSWPRLILLLGTCYLFLTANRNGDTFGLLVPYLVLPREEEADGRGGNGIGRGFGPPALVLMVTFVITIALETAVRPDLKPQDLVRPESCLAAAREHGLPGRRVLNAYEFGGFLLSQDVKTFIDGRTELFGNERLTAYFHFVDLQGETPLAILEAQRIEWTMLHPTQPAVQVLDRLEGWQRVFAAPHCVVHARRLPP